MPPAVARRVALAWRRERTQRTGTTGLHVAADGKRWTAGVKQRKRNSCCPLDLPLSPSRRSITNRALRRGDVARDVALPCRAGRGCRRCGFRLARVRQASAVSHWPVSHQPGRRRAEGAHGELQPRRQLHRLAGRDRHGLRRGAARASVGIQVAPRHDALARHALQVGGGRGAGGSA